VPVGTVDDFKGTVPPARSRCVPADRRAQSRRPRQSHRLRR
jgi:hypothetical protein